MPNLFVRQPFSESGDEECRLIQDVMDMIAASVMRFPDVNIITDMEAQSADTFVKRFENINQTVFTPATFRKYRLNLLDKADAIIHIRTSLSESSAFEIAYNIFKGKRAPILFCVWDRAPLKTTLLRDLQDLCDVTYVTFSRADELRQSVDGFLERFSNKQL